MSLASTNRFVNTNYSVCNVPPGVRVLVLVAVVAVLVSEIQQLVS